MSRATTVRPPAVSGLFYPEDPRELAEAVDDALWSAVPPPQAMDVGAPLRPKGVIAPHAGYAYSGSVAGSAYACLAPLRGSVRRVVLAGPAHRVPLAGVAVPSVDAFATPLGRVEVDTAGRNAALEHACVHVDDLAHGPEHSLEVHLPFIQRALGDVAVLPLVVGKVGSAELADVFDAVWDGPDTVFVISSDLSHYQDYATATRLDRRTADTILSGDAASIGSGDACGAYPVRGFLLAARRHGLKTELVDLRNSGDTAGGKDRVVGYGAFVMFQEETSDSGEAEVAIDADARRVLLETAIGVIDRHLDGSGSGGGDAFGDGLPEAVLRHGASFVTLENRGRLLGCTGTMLPMRPLIEDVAVHAKTSAFADPRLPPVTRRDWHEMSVKISVLSTLEGLAVESLDELAGTVRAGVDGLLIEGAGRRATFLPSVWAKVSTPDEFLSLLWRKAGLVPGEWPADMSVERYTTVEFGDPGPR